MENDFLHLSYEAKIILVKHYKNFSCSRKLHIIAYNFTDEWMQMIQILLLPTSCKLLRQQLY